MESGRLFFDPTSGCHGGNMLFLGSGDPVFRGSRSIMGIEETSSRGVDHSSARRTNCSMRNITMSSCRRRNADSLLSRKQTGAGEKTQLAKKLGLQPRQVAVWFQNRRARWKTKQLERDYDLLKSTYDSFWPTMTPLSRTMRSSNRSFDLVAFFLQLLLTPGNSTSGIACSSFILNQGAACLNPSRFPGNLLYFLVKLVVGLGVYEFLTSISYCVSVTFPHFKVSQIHSYACEASYKQIRRTFCFSFEGKMLDGGPKFTGIIGLNNHDYDLSQGFYHKLGEGSNMSIDSFASLQTSNGGGSVAMSIDNSSVGSNTNDSHTRILNHQGLRRVLMTTTLNSPTLGLENFDEWTIDLKKLNMGQLLQRAFGKLYRGTYKAEEVAIKILERPENDPEKAQLMEQQFQQEVMMLATSAVLMKRQNRAVPLKLAVKQALDVARGMAYVHGLGLIHRDLKSDNLLIFGDKSIKIADFGVACVLRIVELCQHFDSLFQMVICKRIILFWHGGYPDIMRKSVLISTFSTFILRGTSMYHIKLSSEMIQHRPYTQKIDVYSFGIVLWELITGMLPFQNMTAVQAAFAVVNKGVRPIVPNDCLPVLTEIMTRCWDANPDARPHFTEVVRMLENAETEILTTVRKARFRCCMTQPMTAD
ncbi:hypothetical protein FNV43_RR20003 [Rhamnella rubrinervis]|uniref:Protein kinase domain-containing protein n=2 Tax=Rhamnella rubrinervis TaxID=2594499 RepID=A0A8K0E0N5_9ROSA|nr:hypothetical protein FNV43_RR20003 [Rhamnella rubrinervis]